MYPKFQTIVKAELQLCGFGSKGSTVDGDEWCVLRNVDCCELLNRKA
jgi:hypothetical protein